MKVLIFLVLLSSDTLPLLLFPYTSVYKKERSERGGGTIDATRESAGFNNDHGLNLFIPYSNRQKRLFEC